jgi:hypothetical protein
MLVMVVEDMFAQTDVAMYERIEKTSRDIRCMVFLKSRTPINKDIVESRRDAILTSWLINAFFSLKE